MISVMDILSEGPIRYSKIKNSVEVDKKVEMSYKVEAGDLVFVRSSEVVSEVGLVKAYIEKEYALFSGFSIRGKKKAEFDSFFIELSLNSKGRSQMESKAGGSTRFNVSQSILSSINMYQPCKLEQTAIGNFFHTLDTTIILHQRKLKLLKQLKQAYLQQMFPSNDEKVPRLRFADFSGEWEQRKLGELANFNPKAELPDTFKYVDLESVVGTEIISYRKENHSTAPSRAQRLAKTGDLFYQTVRPYQKNNYLFEKPDNNYVFSTGYAQMRPLCDGYFLLCLMQSDLVLQRVLDRCTGTSYPAINTNDLADVDIYTPVQTAEQESVGSYFKILDQAITLNQKKINSFKEIKSIYFKSMFI